MRRVFLFCWDPIASPAHDALLYREFALDVHRLRDGRLHCPIVAPPQLAVLEPAPDRPLASLLHGLAEHPVIGRVPKLLVLDLQWLASADRLPVDDFIVRGYRPAEMVARVARLVGLASAAPPPRPMRFGPLLIDPEGFEARLHDDPLHLTPQEFALLRHLASMPGRAQSRDLLLERVWGRRFDGGARTVDIHVQRLRAKLGTAGAALQTVRGVGYKWTAVPHPG